MHNLAWMREAELHVCTDRLRPAMTAFHANNPLDDVNVMRVLSKEVESSRIQLASTFF